MFLEATFVPSKKAAIALRKVGPRKYRTLARHLCVGNFISAKEALLTVVLWLSASLMDKLNSLLML